MTGRFVWYELMTTDPKKAIAFYSDVVGWKAQPYDDAPSDKPYTMWAGSQGPLGGVMALPDDAKKMNVPPHWMAHVQVDDVDKTVAKAKEHTVETRREPSCCEVSNSPVTATPQSAEFTSTTPQIRFSACPTTTAGVPAGSERMPSRAMPMAAKTTMPAT